MGAALLLGQREPEKVAGMQTGSGSHQGKAKTEAGSGVAPERTVFPGSLWEGRWPVWLILSMSSRRLEDRRNHGQ